MKRLFWAAALFLYPATTHADALCVGSPVVAATAAMAAQPYVVGTEPRRVKESACGGGLSAVGQKTQKWDCLLQTWDVTYDNMAMYVILAYSKVGKKWVLETGKVCSRDLETCTTIPFETCALPSTQGKL